MNTVKITNRFEIPKVQSEAVNCEDRQTMQNTTQKSTDLATQSPLKTSVNSGAPEEPAVPASLVAPIMVLYLKLCKQIIVGDLTILNCVISRFKIFNMVKPIVKS